MKFSNFETLKFDIFAILDECVIFMMTCNNSRFKFSIFELETNYLDFLPRLYLAQNQDIMPVL